MDKKSEASNGVGVVAVVRSMGESFSFPGGQPCKQPHLLVYGRGRGEGSPVIVTTCILFLSIFRFSSRHLVLPMNTPPTGEKPVKGVGFGVG